MECTPGLQVAGALPFRELTPEEEQAVAGDPQRGATSYRMGVAEHAQPTGIPDDETPCDHPWTARRAIAFSLRRLHDGRTRRVGNDVQSL